jgi:hypothetical protein
LEYKDALHPEREKLYDTAAAIAQKKQTSVLAALVPLALKTYGAQWEAISRGKTLWFSGGSWNEGLECDAIKTVYRDELVFPNGEFD